MFLPFRSHVIKNSLYFRVITLLRGVRRRKGDEIFINDEKSQTLSVFKLHKLQLFASDEKKIKRKKNYFLSIFRKKICYFVRPRSIIVIYQKKEVVNVLYAQKYMLKEICANYPEINISDYFNV